jgi:hypothetical protein
MDLNQMEDRVTMIEYQYDFIKDNPIQARCEHCRRIEPINAPTLENVLCFWCGPNRKSRLKPVDRKAYEQRLANLWRYTVDPQQALYL